MYTVHIINYHIAVFFLILVFASGFFPTMTYYAATCPPWSMV